MIEAIMSIGDFVSGRDKREGLLSTLVDNPNTNGRYKKVICIVLTGVEGGGYSFKEVDLEYFKEDYIHRYLYKSGSSSGCDLTPTSKISKKGAGGTFESRILYCLNKIEQNKDKLEIGDEGKSQIKGILAAINKSKDEIKNRVEEAAKEIERGTNAIITLKIEPDQYVGDLSVFKKVLISEAVKGYYSNSKGESKGSNEVCSVCQKRQVEVYGFVNTYNFYTVDKPGFITGGFRQKDAWKNYPVCPECALRLERGKKYLQENLRFNFYGFRYLLIPNFFNQDAMKEVFDELEYQYFDKEGDKMIKASLAQRYKRRLTDAEDEIFDYISLKKDYLNLNLLFYEEQQGAFRILLYVEDILPSRFKRLFEAKDKIDRMEIFRNELSKEGKQLLKFNFGTIMNFFPFSRRNNKWVGNHKYYLDIVSRIFSLKNIDYNFLMGQIMQKIRRLFVNVNNEIKNEEPIFLSDRRFDNYKVTDFTVRQIVMQALMLLYYLKELSVLKRGGEVVMEEELREEDSLGVEKFFAEHKDFFDSDARKAIFLEGVLVQKLLNIQRLPDVSNAPSGKEPFRPRLKGLKLDEKLIKKLLPEIQNKLEEYGKNYYRQLETTISEYMVAAGSDWKMGMDEISFYFVLGMNLSGLFKAKKEEGKDEQDNQQE